MDLLRTLFSIQVEQSWDHLALDVTAAYLQANGFCGQIYVRPPREECDTGTLWKLEKAAYGLVDSERLWYLISNEALCSKFGVIRSQTEPTLYFEKDAQGDLQLLILVQVDNYICTGTGDRLSSFRKFLCSEFRTGTIEEGN